jgi:hypothetical protein
MAAKSSWEAFGNKASINHQFAFLKGNSSNEPKKALEADKVSNRLVREPGQ